MPLPGPLRDAQHRDARAEEDAEHDAQGGILLQPREVPDEQHRTEARAPVTVAPASRIGSDLPDPPAADAIMKANPIPGSVAWLSRVAHQLPACARA